MPPAGSGGAGSGGSGGAEPGGGGSGGGAVVGGSPGVAGRGGGGGAPVDPGVAGASGSGGSGGAVAPPDAGPPDAPEPDAAPPPPDLAPDTPPPPPDLARGLAGHWKLDEGLGNVVLDSSPIQNHGGTINILAADWKAMGRRGGALQFTGARRTFAQISHHETIAPREGVSLTVWANAASWAGTQRLLEKGKDGQEYGLRVQGNRLLLLLRLEDGTEVRLSAPPPPTGRFTHLAGTYDGQQAQLYVDGKSVATMALPGALAVGMGNLVLAGRPAGEPDTEFFTGQLDDVVIYGRGLSAVEVRMLFMAGAP